MIILHQNCDPELAKDKGLPLDSFLVSYISENQLCHDIVRSGTQVEIFDHYYDKSFELKSIKWTNGSINPKTYGYTPKDPKKKRK